jgi:uncharacterized membrane protein HdeD (DUF308 family)
VGLLGEGYRFEQSSNREGQMSTAAAVITRRSTGWSMVWGVLLILFGLFAIASPLASSFGAVLVIGWMMIFSSAAQVLHALQSRGIGHIVWKLLVAVLYFGVGIYLLNNPLLGIATLTLAIGIFFFAEGIMDLSAFFKDRKVNGSGWILLNGIVALALGLMIWQHWLASSMWAVGTLVGICMVMTGVSRLMISVAVRRLSEA